MTPGLEESRAAVSCTLVDLIGDAPMMARWCATGVVLHVALQALGRVVVSTFSGALNSFVARGHGSGHELALRRSRLGIPIRNASWELRNLARVFDGKHVLRVGFLVR